MGYLQDRSHEKGSVCGGGGGGGLAARSLGGSNEETSSQSPGPSHVCEAEEETEESLSHSSGQKYFLSAVEEAQTRPGGDTVRGECRTPSCDHPKRSNPQGLSTFPELQFMSAEGSRERVYLPGLVYFQCRYLALLA